MQTQEFLARGESVDVLGCNEPFILSGFDGWGRSIERCFFPDVSIRISCSRNGPFKRRKIRRPPVNYGFHRLGGTARFIPSSGRYS
jgi:hypothetical protein